MNKFSQFVKQKTK